MSTQRWQRTGSLLASGLLALSMAACTGADDTTGGGGSPAASGGGSGSPGATPSGSSAGSAPSGGTPAASVLAAVTIVRTGGIAGVAQTLIVEGDGRWTYRDRSAEAKSGTLDAPQRQQLQTLLADPALASEAGRHVAGTCNDGFHYALTAGSTVIDWEDCGGDPPKTAEAVRHLLVEATPL